MRTLIVGVCGGSGSGKTTFARALAEAAGPAVILAEDDYYVCRTAVPDFDAATRDFDHPSAKDFDRLLGDMQALRTGRTIRRPVYDFASHSRTGEVDVAPAPLVIVEGLHLLSDPRLVAEADRLIFVAAPDETRFERRLARDVAERGRTTECVTAQWTNTVLPAHRRWTEPFAARAHLTVDGCGDLSVELARALKDLGLTAATAG